MIRHVLTLSTKSKKTQGVLLEWMHMADMGKNPFPFDARVSDYELFQDRGIMDCCFDIELNYEPIPHEFLLGLLNDHPALTIEAILMFLNNSDKSEYRWTPERGWVFG
jgi:hypothetical protein